MLWLYRFLMGYVTVLFSGDFCEKILNLTAKNRITLWDSRLTKKGIESNLLARDFKRLRAIIRKSEIKAHILKRKGLPFKTAKYNKRIGLLIGAVIFMAFLKVMSGFIWVIDINGNETVSSSQILSACKEIGIKEGVKRSSIHTKTDRERLLLKLDKLAWASLNIEGSRLGVNVTERKKNEADETAPSNLKATADGIIKKIDIVSGNCLVKTGDAVKKGDILVSGVIEKLSGTHFVKSQGTITAQTVEEIKLEGKYKTEKTINSGKQKTKNVLEIFSLKIPLFLGEEKGEFKTYKDTKSLSFLEKDLPLRIHSKTFYFYETYKLTYSKEQLKAELQKKLEKGLEKDSSIIESNVTETTDGLILTALVSNTKNIALEEKMLISENNESPLG